ncbi:MAG TPA: hypothetical protein PLX97_06320 [Gemmatales bacterium]|nr:hypothetical protein [Gemmatales bacterium]
MIQRINTKGLAPADIRQLQSLATQLRTQAKRKRAKQQASDTQFEKAMDLLCKGLPKLPSLPADFSRADLYQDHD